MTCIFRCAERSLSCPLCASRQNEHHDFPRIPGSRLRKLHAIAPEFYDNLASHNSYCGVIWRYITDPAIGPFSRVMRAVEQIGIQGESQASTPAGKEDVAEVVMATGRAGGVRVM